MAMREIRFGVVGCGKISQRHMEIVQATDGLELSAVCDPTPGRVEEVGRQFDVKSRFTDYRDLLEARVCDAVILCTPSGLHGEMIEAAAGAGLHVLVEKPLEVTLAKVDSAIRACRKAGVRLGVVYQRRGLRLFRRLAEVVGGGGLGQLALADTEVKWFRPSHYYDPGSWHGSKEMEGGGALANQGVHGIDAVQWVAGGVESVMAYITTRAHPVEVEDTAVVAVRYRNGAIGTIAAATSSYPGEPLTFRFHGPEGTLLIENERIRRWVERGDDRTETMQREHEGWPEYGDRYAGHRVLIRDLADAIREQRDPVVNGLVGRESVAILEAIYESARTGKEAAVQGPPEDLKQRVE